MTSPSVTTESALRKQVLRYLQVGDRPDDYDVDGIVTEVQQRFGNVSIYDIPSEQWIDIVMIHDTSAITARAELQPVLDRLNRFFTSAHAELPAPHTFQCIVNVPTRAALDGLAGDFGQGVPEPAVHFRGAQFGVSIPGAGPSIRVLFSYYEGAQ